MIKSTFLCTLALCLGGLLSAQTSYTKTYDFIPQGESVSLVTPYHGGFLLTSAQYGIIPTVENTLRMVDVNDSVTRSIKFEEPFRFYFHPTTGITQLGGYFTATVTDINGKIILQDVFSNSIDLSGEASGMYFVTLRNSEGTLVQRGKLVRE